MLSIFRALLALAFVYTATASPPSDVHTLVPRWMYQQGATCQANCNVHYTPVNNVCTCQAGYYTLGSECIVCPDQTTSTAGATVCTSLCSDPYVVDTINGGCKLATPQPSGAEVGRRAVERRRVERRKFEEFVF
ncbi:hypothetical protein MNV49_001568 [Pseudohyphozyma bogoriensis]|nr:hypothetical protein MNV49_001568 [Pseudohyphozyma bogoriensis]